jgi:hypothetical protein
LGIGNQLQDLNKSPNLTAVDLFCWGLSQEEICQSNPRKIYKLEQQIRDNLPHSSWFVRKEH